MMITKFINDYIMVINMRGKNYAIFFGSIIVGAFSTCVVFHFWNIGGSSIHYLFPNLYQLFSF